MRPYVLPAVWLHLLLSYLAPSLLPGQTKPWKPAVYAHHAGGTGAASLRARTSELVGTDSPRQVTIRSVSRFVPARDTWEPVAIPLPRSVRVPVPAPRQVYSSETDPVLLDIPHAVGLFWAEWEEDGHPVASFAYAGPILCEDVMLGPAPAGRIAVCVPFPDRAEARFVPDPAHRTLRPLPARLTGCDSSQVAPGDSVYEADAVDQPVRSRRLTIEWVPLRIGHVLRGHTALRFIVERSGKINRCSFTILEEAAPGWTDAVVRELRNARYQPAKRAGQTVRQWVYQLFTYHSDGRDYDAR